jgi:hypothetical protein
MNKYQEALKEITHLTFVETKYYEMLKKLAEEKDEQESRKDKLVVGSVWECVIDCYGSEHEFVVVHSVKVFEILDDKVRIGYDWMPKQQFLLCFKPR